MTEGKVLVEQEALDLTPLHEILGGGEKGRRSGDPCSSESARYLRLAAFLRYGDWCQQP
ncbi:hypothetical protein LM599_05625 [Candidatus Acetothermia bacterium]|nr:hypothetical protein [Candidatus Acetothermia bacterium]MCI2427240.1 hypothetical protein [Candidatus Acetothermia bacterium]MCI2428752.1 hypothetical protein [Candidatus Acetothermia bacterium]